MERNFIGIGKIIIDTPTEVWNVPHLHFIVSKCDNETFEAVNLEFGLVSIDKTGWDAAQGLASLACTYLISVINEGNGFKELQETVRQNPFHDLWGEFRKIEFELAETGDDLSHHFDKRINRAKLCFEVTVFNNIHKVSAMYIHNLERIHRIDLSAIINACVI